MERNIMKGLPFSPCVCVCVCMCVHVHAHYSMHAQPTQSHSSGATHTHTHTHTHIQLTGAVCSSASFSSCVSFIFHMVNESKANRRRRRRRRRRGNKRKKKRVRRPYVTEPGERQKVGKGKRKVRKSGGQRSKRWLKKRRGSSWHVWRLVFLKLMLQCVAMFSHMLSVDAAARQDFKRGTALCVFGCRSPVRTISESEKQIHVSIQRQRISTSHTYCM